MLINFFFFEIFLTAETKKVEGQSNKKEKESIDYKDPKGFEKKTAPGATAESKTPETKEPSKSNNDLQNAEEKEVSMRLFSVGGKIIFTEDSDEEVICF